MTIEVPECWGVRFQAYEQAEALLRGRFCGDGPRGVSRADINRVFAAFGGVSSAWADPAFRVWAAVRGCVKAEQFFDRWRA